MSRLSLGVWPVLLACNVSPAPTTGGADLPSRGECPRGLAVVSSDYQSSEVALLSPAGDVVSAAFLSSASGSASNLAAPLSGDVTVAASRRRPNELVIVDRFGTNVLTFVDAATASVRAQLAIGTGFDANAQAYLEVGEHKAYVPRLGENAAPGRQPFDAGSDLLLVDPVAPRIVASLPLPRRPGYLPNPAALARFEDVVLVTLQHARADFSGMADSELVAIDVQDESLRYRIQLEGLQNCGRVEVSPNRRSLALGCASYVDRNGAAPDASGSGIVLFDATSSPPRELQRFAARELVGGPVQSSLEYVTDDLLLFKSQTALGAPQDNQLLSLELASGRTQPLAAAARDPNGLGYGIAFMGMSCHVDCGDPCLVADASRDRLARFRLDAGELVGGDDVWLRGAGLPPTGVTPFW